ncbi:LysE family translocator [Salinicola corii]|uniref:LysE family translocator n=1 Tax=Salinicola corii TaxID=2606937 RepID=A0A640WGX0_9GAMM|nr:LysE family translocator [Salinicola corii]KAA0019663.1 LysE family translocator [Salinicola corii]
MTTEFLLTALIVVLLPGTGVLYTLANGLGGGARAAILAALGCTLGIAPQLLLATLGLTAVLETSDVLFQALRLAGTLYLLFMAWQVGRARGVMNVDTQHSPRGSLRLIGTGIWLNLLNPKLGLFFLAFLPQFVPADNTEARTTFFLLGLIFVAMTLLVFIGYGLMAAWVRDHVIGRPRVMAFIRASFAAAFVLLALRLGFETL